MNWPNRLTLLRVGLIPVMLLFLYINNEFCQGLALGLFLAASFTDFLDGYLARRHHIVTTFGKFLDPVADKLLVLSAMIGLCGLGRFPAWACIVVLFREISVDGLRLISIEQGRVIAAGKLGKVKTVTQMVTLVIFFLNNWPFSPFPMDSLMLGLTVVMTLWSGFDYFWKNRELVIAPEAMKNR